MAKWSWACGIAAPLVFAAAASASDFKLVSSDLTLNKAADRAEFDLTFNRVPVFGKLSATGVPADSFQIDFAGSPVLGTDPANQSDVTAVIRGDEIHIGQDVRVRSTVGDGGVDGGGWGPVVGAVPYKLTGNTMSFAVPASDLGVTGGKYGYQAFSLNYGSLSAVQNVTLVPTPTAATGGFVGLGLVATVMAIGRRMKRAALAG